MSDTITSVSPQCGSCSCETPVLMRCAPCCAKRRGQSQARVCLRATAVRQRAGAFRCMAVGRVGRITARRVARGRWGNPCRACLLVADTAAAQWCTYGKGIGSYAMARNRRNYVAFWQMGLETGKRTSRPADSLDLKRMLTYIVRPEVATPSTLCVSDVFDQVHARLLQEPKGYELFYVGLHALNGYYNAHASSPNLQHRDGLALTLSIPESLAGQRTASDPTLASVTHLLGLLMHRYKSIDEMCGDLVHYRGNVRCSIRYIMVKWLLCDLLLGPNAGDEQADGASSRETPDALREARTEERAMAMRIGPSSLAALVGFVTRANRNDGRWIDMSWDQLRAWFQHSDRHPLRHTLRAVWERVLRIKRADARHQTQSSRRPAGERCHITRTYIGVAVADYMCCQVARGVRYSANEWRTHAVPSFMWIDPDGADGSPRASLSPSLLSQQQQQQQQSPPLCSREYAIREHWFRLLSFLRPSDPLATALGRRQQQQCQVQQKTYKLPIPREPSGAGTVRQLPLLLPRPRRKSVDDYVQSAPPAGNAYQTARADLAAPFGWPLLPPTPPPAGDAPVTDNAHLVPACGSPKEPDAPAQRQSYYEANNQAWMQWLVLDPSDCASDGLAESSPQQQCVSPLPMVHSHDRGNAAEGCPHLASHSTRDDMAVKRAREPDGAEPERSPKRPKNQTDDSGSDRRKETVDTQCEIEAALADAAACVSRLARLLALLRHERR